ncbi:MAG: Hpt domain-containing protein [Anaerolineales bacterium]|jgi:HPt (histidine-containing phosphotransfer) domain-containing protein|nr:Hpt domain-containing protein [Anaerolineales bacterium]
MSVINMDTLNSLKETTGAEFVRELMDTFFEDSPKLISALKNALAAKDADAFRRAAHSIKSNAATFGAEQLSALARELEGRGRENDLEIGSRLEALEEAFQEAKSQLIELR